MGGCVLDMTVNSRVSQWPDIARIAFGVSGNCLGNLFKKVSSSS
jgi:hypothetical protein